MCAITFNSSITEGCNLFTHKHKKEMRDEKVSHETPQFHAGEWMLNLRQDVELTLSGTNTTPDLLKQTKKCRFQNIVC